jgi:hypothetical protein
MAIFPHPSACRVYELLTLQIPVPGNNSVAQANSTDWATATFCVWRVLRGQRNESLRSLIIPVSQEALACIYTSFNEEFMLDIMAANWLPMNQQDEGYRLPGCDAVWTNYLFPRTLSVLSTGLLHVHVADSEMHIGMQHCWEG